MISDKDILGSLQGRTRKQHYLPRFFIQNFADDRGNLAVLQIIDNKAKVTVNRKAETVCVQRDIYEVAQSGSCTQVPFPNGIENLFSKIECGLSKELDRCFGIMETCLAGKACSKEEIDGCKCLLATMIALFACRSPAFANREKMEIGRWLADLQKAGFSSQESIRLEFERVLGRSIAPIDLTPELLAQFLAIYSLVIPYNIKGCVSLPYRLTCGLSRLDLEIRASPVGCPFVGIDFPVIAKLPLNSSGDGSCIFPLSSRFLACFVEKGGHEAPFVDCCSKQEVKRLNKEVLASKSWKVAFCCDRLPLDGYVC